VRGMEVMDRRERGGGNTNTRGLTVWRGTEAQLGEVLRRDGSYGDTRGIQKEQSGKVEEASYVWQRPGVQE
jgi:hypothetical protein